MSTGSDNTLVVCRIDGHDSIMTLETCEEEGGIVIGPAGGDAVVGQVVPRSPEEPGTPASGGTDG